MENKKNDSFFRIAGILGLLLLLVIFAWLSNKSNYSGHDDGKGHDHSDPAQHGNIEGAKLDDNDSELKTSGKVIDGKRTVNYEAFQYAFSPDPLIVRSGETVILKLKSRDVEHGMMIPEIDFTSNMPVKQIKTVSFQAPSSPGKYPIFCSIYCGSDHGNMKGTLIVLPENEEEEKDGH